MLEVTVEIYNDVDCYSSEDPIHNFVIDCQDYSQREFLSQQCLMAMQKGRTVVIYPEGKGENNGR